MRPSIVVIFAILLLFPAYAFASEQDIVINEIAAYESSDYEWIEIFNKGSEKVDITGWKFFEGSTNHKMTVFRGSAGIEPGTYAIIANDAAKIAQKYPLYTGQLFDSSWSSLSEKGEEIGLKNSKSVNVEQFTYGATLTGSLERKDAEKADYTSANWKEYAKSNTIGAKNSISGSSGQSQGGGQADSSQPVTPDKMTVPQVWIPLRGDILINELVADPEEGEKEWIELYNPTRNEVELSGWSIENGAGSSIMLSGTLGSQDLKKFFIVDLPPGFFKNSGEHIELRNARKVLIDMVTYGDWDDGDLLDNAPRALDPGSIARAGDGANTFHNRSDFRVTTTPTRGEANRITRDSDETSHAPSSLVISEILPNPASQKPNDEFIELYNNGSEPVNLEGWTLNNADGRAFTFHAQLTQAIVIDPKKYFVATRQLTNLALRNVGGDRVKLFSPGGEKAIALLAYQHDAPLGMSYASVVPNTYHWTRTPTPGEKNIVVQENQGPEIVLHADQFGAVGQFMTFDASDSDDPDNDPLDILWDFGDGTVGWGPVMNHVYEKEGRYTLLLSVGDGKKRTVLTKNILISSEQSQQNDTHVSSVQREEVAGEKHDTKKRKKQVVLGDKKSAPLQKRDNAKISIGSSLSTIKNLSRGTRVTVTGVVAVEPGILSDAYFYIAGSGIQIWNAKKIFPKLHRGDRVSIRGTLKKNGQDGAISIEKDSDIQIQSSEEEPAAHDITIKDIGDPVNGWLVRTTGVITKVQWPNIYLEQDGAHVRVYVARTTGISRIALDKGETLTVRGIVSETKAGFRILPRDPDDFTIAKKEESNASREKVSAQEQSQEKNNARQWDFLRYGVTALAAFLVIAGGLLFEKFFARKDGMGNSDRVAATVDREKMD
jgi:hypothetical protein